MTTRVRFADAVCAVGVSESVTLTVMGKLPVTVGVPVIVPFELKVRLVGKLPLVRLQVYAPAPPLAASVAL